MWRWNLTEVIKELEGHLEDLQIGKTISTGDVVEAPGKDHNLGCFGDWYHHHGDQWQNSGPFSLHLFLYVYVCRHETVSHHQNWTCMHGWVCWPVTMIGRWVWWVFLTQHTCKTSRRAAPFRVRGFCCQLWDVIIVCDTYCGSRPPGPPLGYDGPWDGFDPAVHLLWTVGLMLEK